MKAAVCNEFGQPLIIENIDIADPGPGQVRVRLSACAICHSDILYCDGAWGGDLPAVFGHEAAGIIDIVGPGVEGLVKGAHVVVTLIRSCGKCYYCVQGAPTACEKTFSLDKQSPLSKKSGKPIIHGLRTGAFAEYVLVDASQVVVISDDISLETASLLACSVITGIGAVTNTANVFPGSTVCVIGAGGVGLNSIQGAVIVGAEEVIAIDIEGKKLKVAEEFGATKCFNALTTNVVSSVLNCTGGRGVDFVFVTVGVKSAFQEAFEMIGKLGSVVLVGMPPDDVMAEFQPVSFANDGKRILGSKMGSSRIQIDIPFLVALYKKGRLKLDELISGRYRLEEINEAILAVKNGTAIRNIIVF